MPFSYSRPQKIFFSEIKKREQKKEFLISLLYRFNTLDEKTVKEGMKEFRYLIVDGTGFGYNKLYSMKLERRKRIKEIKGKELYFHCYFNLFIVSLLDYNYDFSNTF